MQYLALIYARGRRLGIAVRRRACRGLRAVRRLRARRSRGGRRRGRRRARPHRGRDDRPRAGRQVAVTDGPYAEAKEALGGYYLLDCATIDEAVDWAARIPGALHGAVEVRAVHVDPEGA